MFWRLEDIDWEHPISHKLVFNVKLISVGPEPFEQLHDLDPVPAWPADGGVEQRVGYATCRALLRRILHLPG